MPCARSVWGVLFLVSATAALPDEARVPPSSEAVENARQQLQNIPAADANVGSSKALDIRIPVSNFTGSSSPAPFAQSTKVEQPESEGWLVDGFKQSQNRDTALKLEQSAKAEGRTDGTMASKRAMADRPDLMAQMMQSWLSPDTRSLLKTDARPGEGSHRENVGSFSAVKPHGPIDATPRFDSRSQNRAINAPQPNPYLTAGNESSLPSFAAPVQGLTTTSLTPTSEQDSSSYRLHSALAYPKEDDNATNAPAAARQPRLSADLPSPTAPLIDEQRYFPQLRRF